MQTHKYLVHWQSVVNLWCTLILTLELKSEVGFVLLDLQCMFCRSLFVLLYFFLLAIVLFVLLGYTNSDYPFGIFKLFFQWFPFFVNHSDSTSRDNMLRFVRIYNCTLNFDDCTPKIRTGVNYFKVKKAGFEALWINNFAICSLMKCVVSLSSRKISQAVSKQVIKDQVFEKFIQLFMFNVMCDKHASCWYIDRSIVIISSTRVANRL